ncbi:MAG TPA: DAK2 domain-containing protein [Tissierellia bacterium]|nr:DAK2 domain-containing protein [Tissierellia bacterium]
MNITYIDGFMLKKAFIGAANLLEKNKEEVNSLNVFPVPDGDTGTNMYLTLKSAVNQISKLDDYEESISRIALAASNGSLMGARGNSGVILSQLLRGFSNGVKGKEKLDTIAIANAFKMASDTAYKAVMKPTEGTILTVARESAEYALSISDTEKDILKFMEKVIKHANEVLDRTPEMLKVLKDAGVVDAGGKGLIFVLTGAYYAIANKEFVDMEETKKEMEKEVTHETPFLKELDTSDIKYGYCTEFMINTNIDDYDAFRNEISAFGDSLLVVGGEGLIKVHIHTNNPGIVLEKALNLGELSDIKIDNMRYQHRHILAKENDTEVHVESKNEKAYKKYSFISVSVGEGLDNIFKELNVDCIIPGGQTMNPSTEDILNAIEKVNGEYIIVLPNNGNIILAAEQARELSNKNVYVLPTKTIPEGISSLIAFDPELEVEENIENMKEAFKHVITGQVTYSVRDSEINNKKINKNDIIGISKGEVVSNGNNIEEVSFNLIKSIVNENSSLITIYYGNGIEEDEAERLADLIKSEYEDFDVEVLYGGQPLYYYIFSVE